jgi:hypothetical protein
MSIFKLMIFVLLLAVPAAANVLTFDFHNYQNVEIDVPWMDQGLTFVVESTGSTPLAFSYIGGLSLGTNVVTLDLSPLDDVRRIEAEIRTTDDTFPTMVTLFDDVGMVDGVSSADRLTTETLSLLSSGAQVHWYRISSTACRLETINVFYGPVANDSATWSSIKALYR